MSSVQCYQLSSIILKTRVDWSWTGLESTYLIAGEVLQGGGGDLVGVGSLQVLQGHCRTEHVCRGCRALQGHGAGAGEGRREVRMLELCDGGPGGWEHGRQAVLEYEPY